MSTPRFDEELVEEFLASLYLYANRFQFHLEMHKRGFQVSNQARMASFPNTRQSTPPVMTRIQVWSASGFLSLLELGLPLPIFIRFS